MNEIISKIEQTVSDLFRYDMKNYVIHAQELADMMMAIFPVIINIYNDPRMSDVRENALYWPGQLEHILNTFKKGDMFEAVDVLYNETRPKLIELRDMLISRGIL